MSIIPFYISFSYPSVQKCAVLYQYCILPPPLIASPLPSLVALMTKIQYDSTFFGAVFDVISYPHRVLFRTQDCIHFNTSELNP